jgi:hypothetical protein
VWNNNHRRTKETAETQKGESLIPVAYKESDRSKDSEVDP